MSRPIPLQLRLCMFLNYCAYAVLLNSVGVAVLQAQRCFGVSLVEAGSLAIFKGAGILSGALVAGTFLKRIGYKRAMLAALAASALALVAVPFFANFAALKWVFLITGLCYGVMKVTLYSTVGLLAPDKQEHGSLLAFVESFYKIGSLLTFVVFAAFTDNADPRSTSWAQAYTLLAGVMLVAFFLLWPTALDESSVQDAPGRPWLEPLLDLLRLAATPVAATLGVLVFASIVSEHGFINWLPTFNHRVLGLTPSLGIQLAGLYAVCAIVGRVGVGFVLRCVAWFPVLVTCVIGAGVTLVAGLLAASGVEHGVVEHWHAAPLATFLLPLAGLFVGPVWPLIHSAALTSLPVARQNTLASLSVVFSSTSGAIGTPLLGLIFARFGGVAALGALLFPVALLAIGGVALRRVTSRGTPPS